MVMMVEPLRRAMDLALREGGPEILAYGPTAGHPPLRETIAAAMRREEAPVEAEQILRRLDSGPETEWPRELSSACRRLLARLEPCSPP